MEFIRRNINKTNRNGTVYIGSSLTLPNISNVDITNYQGNFLPATDNGDGSYTVDASSVVFTGEISAYGAGTSSGGGGGSVTIVDNLTSTATDAALSANQGRVLKELIDNIDVGDVDLSGYVTLNSEQTITANKTFTTNITINKGNSIVDENGWGIIGINPTGWTGLPSDGSAIGIGTGAAPVYIRSNGSLFNYIKSENKSYNILDSKNYSSYSLPLSGGTITGTLSIKRDSSVIRYYDSAGTLQGWLGFNGVNNPVVFEQDGVTTRQLLHAGNYSNWALPITGGTITNQGTGLFINRNQANANPHICFKVQGTNVGDIGVTYNGIPSFYDYKQGAWKAMLYDGNYSNFALPLSGGTLTGSLYLDSSKSAFIRDTQGGAIIGYSNNSTNIDGAISTGSNFFGSPSTSTVIRSNGTLRHYRGDTKSSYQILDASNTEFLGSYSIDASALSTSNFYPIIFAQSAKPLIVRMYSLGGNGSVAYNRNDLEFTFRGQGWTDAPQGLTVHFYNCYTASETTIGCIGMGQEGGAKVVWVRGGIKYAVYSNIAPSLKTANYADGNQIFTVGTNFSGGTNTKVSTYWTPQTTSGLGTMYHSSGLAVGAGLSVQSNASIKGTLTNTGLATFSGGLTTTTGTFNRINAGSVSWRNNLGAQISKVGWYRFAVATIANNSAGNVIFTIRREYYNTDNESYILMANIDYGGCNWTQLGGSYRTQLITKVRCTYDSNSTMYFDFYYNGTAQNGVYVNCIGDAYCQTPTLVTSGLAVHNETSLTNGYKMGSKNAYQMTLYRNATNGGSFIQYGANNQLTKTWAAGADNQLRFGWYYKDTSAGTDVEKMWLDSTGNLFSNNWTLSNVATNPYLKLIHTYSGTTYTHYLQGYNGYLYLGAGSAKSLRIDSSGNCLSVGEVTAHSDKRLKDNIKPLTVRGELNPVTYTKDGKESIGFIADEVKEIYPELVITDDSTEDKYLSLNYAQLTAVLAAEIKELKERITQLENK